MAFLSGLIGAGISVIGNIIGGNSRAKAAQKAAEQERRWALQDRDESRQYARGTYKRLVEDAEAAGFNPLTALRNGGAAGYSLYAATPALTSSGLGASGAVGEAIGQGIAGIGNFIANFDPFEDKLREAQYGLMQAQLENLQVDTAARRAAMFNVPAVSGRRVVSAGPALGGTLPPEMVVPTVTNPWPTHSGMEVNPGFVDAEAWETRYGDIFQEVGGLGNLIVDTYGNLPRAWKWMASGVKVRKLTPAEQPVGSHWWPAFMPRVSIRWK